MYEIRKSLFSEILCQPCFEKGSGSHLRVVTDSRSLYVEGCILTHPHEEYQSYLLSDVFDLGL